MSHRSLTVLVVLIAVVVGGALAPLTAGQRVPPLVGATVQRSAANAARASAAVIAGQVLNSNRTSLAFARVRLRNLDSGTIVGKTSADHRGEFEFLVPTGGNYVAELLNETDHVLAAGEAVTVEVGQTVGTLIVLPARGPSFAGLFGNSAAAIVSAAASAGIAAVGATGQPLSPEK
jgi:hypothetical protein